MYKETLVVLLMALFLLSCEDSRSSPKQLEASTVNLTVDYAKGMGTSPYVK
jgi:hypothetical protein